MDRASPTETTLDPGENALGASLVPQGPGTHPRAGGDPTVAAEERSRKGQLLPTSRPGPAGPPARTPPCAAARSSRAAGAGVHPKRRKPPIRLPLGCPLGGARGQLWGPRARAPSGAHTGESRGRDSREGPPGASEWAAARGGRRSARRPVLLRRNSPSACAAPAPPPARPAPRAPESDGDPTSHQGPPGQWETGSDPVVWNESSS